MSGDLVAFASRSAPVLNSLGSNGRLIVASGKSPTTSPAFSAASASRKLCIPASRSTEMWCMPRINGPANQWAKIGSLAMKRTYRRD